MSRHPLATSERDSAATLPPRQLCYYGRRGLPKTMDSHRQTMEQLEWVLAISLRRYLVRFGSHGRSWKQSSTSRSRTG
jgi:hypothetical protein